MPATVWAWLEQRGVKPKQALPAAANGTAVASMGRLRGPSLQRSPPRAWRCPSGLTMVSAPGGRRDKKGYSGVTTYVREAYAPLSCEADCLGDGGGDEDLDREGRWADTGEARSGHQGG